jgi:hypothetical protein
VTTLHRSPECPRTRIQTILNRVEKFKSFVYDEVRLEEQDDGPALVVRTEPRCNSRPTCHAAQTVEPDGLLDLRVHEIHDRSERFRSVGGLSGTAPPAT